MRSLKSRLKTVFWSLVFVFISGIGFYGCILTPIRTGTQSVGSSRGGNHSSISFEIEREASAVGFWLVTGFYSCVVLLLFVVGATSLISGIRGTGSLSVGSSDDDGDGKMDLAKALQEIEELKTMKPAKREKQLRNYLTGMELMQIEGKTPDQDEEAVKQAVNEIIRQDLDGMTDAEKEAYWSRIAPDKATVELFERLRNRDKT